MGGIPHFRTDPTSYGCLCMLMSYPITSLLIQAKNPYCWCLTPIISLFYPWCPCRNQRKWGKIARQGLNPIIYIIYTYIYNIHIYIYNIHIYIYINTIKSLFAIYIPMIPCWFLWLRFWTTSFSNSSVGRHLGSWNRMWKKAHRL